MTELPSQLTPDQSALVPPIEFLIVGAMKCGTTALVRGLAEHPQLFLPEREVHFFDDAALFASVWNGSELDESALDRAYGQHFPDRKLRLGTKAPSYMALPDAVARMHLFHPGARVVAMLRDPIARAQSHWNHLLRAAGRGRVDLDTVGHSFMGHAERAQTELDAQDSPDDEISLTNVLHRGNYAPQIERLWSTFGREHVFVGLLEDLKAHPEPFFEELLGFLGVEMSSAVVAAAQGEKASRKPHTEVFGQMERAFLAEYYADAVQETRELLGRPLAGWCEA